MSTQEVADNKKLIISPEFKKQLLSLKRIANAELNIQICVDKMVSDIHYRLTVLSELDGLGSDALNILIAKLKRAPVYIKPPSSVAESKFSTTLISATKKYSQCFLFVLALIIFIVVFLFWKSNYILIGKGDTVPLRSTSDDLSFTQGIDKALSLPSKEAEVALRLHGSNTIGENLAPKLLEAYLRINGVTQMMWLAGRKPGERELQYIQNENIYAIQLHAHGSSTGFKDLLNGDADIGLSSRKIKPEEKSALMPTLGNLTLNGKEYVIGLDGIAIIVNKDNRLSSVTNEQLAKIFSGEIVNWNQIGGENLEINLYARDKNSGTWDTFNSLVLKANGKQLKQMSERIESSAKLAELVTNDIAGIGFIGLPYVNDNKALAISSTENSALIYPTAFTVSTEDYSLSRRLYMYVPNNDNEMAQAFSQFVISEKGQNIVENADFVSQNIKREVAYRITNAPFNYNDYADIANRLSVSFRFESGSNTFDNKAKRDIKRLVDYLSLHNGRRVILMGFSDSTGSSEVNLALSLERASKLAQELNAYGISITAVEGFGAELPVASNENARGRSKNRRVEVWVF